MFLHEDEVRAAYDAAETVMLRHMDTGAVRIDANSSAGRRTIAKLIAREIADAVIRSTATESGDITDLPGVEVERNEHAN